MSLRQNIKNLFMVQVISYLVPLLQLPYLSRVLGIDVFGLYVFSYSLISFLLIITNFGFDVFLPQKIASQKIEGIELNKIFTQTLIVRSFLFFITLIFLGFLFFLNRDFKENPNVAWAVAFAVFCNTYSLLWLYQAKECIHMYAKVTLIAKIFSMSLIYIFVNSSDDVGFAIFCLGLGNLLGVVYSKYLAYKIFSIKIENIKLHTAFDVAKESFEFFISRLFVAFYAVAGGVILGVFSTSLAEVAYYGAAQQLYAAGVYAMSALSTPLAPYMARTKNFNVFFKVLALSLVLVICGSLFGVFFGDNLIVLIFGEAMIPAKDILDIFMITIFFSVLGIHFGYPALQPLGKVAYANRSVVAAGFIQIFIVGFYFLMGIEINAINIALSYLLCDLCMTLFRIIVFAKSYRG